MRKIMSSEDLKNVISTSVLLITTSITTLITKDPGWFTAGLVIYFFIAD